jgi:hypothetical protein
MALPESCDVPWAKNEGNGGVHHEKLWKNRNKKWFHYKIVGNDGECRYEILLDR